MVKGWASCSFLATQDGSVAMKMIRAIAGPRREVIRLWFLSTEFPCMWWGGHSCPPSLQLQRSLGLSAKAKVAILKGRKREPCPLHARRSSQCKNDGYL